MTSIRQTFFTRPLSHFGIMIALHTFFIGVGFLVEGSVKLTPLFKYINEYMPTELFGVVSVAIGLALTLSFIFKKERAIGVLAQMQSILWMFVTILYFAHGSITIGISNALIWVLLSAYSAFVYENRWFWTS